MRDIFYQPSGICCKLIEAEADDKGVITYLRLEGGCDGLHTMLTQMFEGKTIDFALDFLPSNVTCGHKTTSCSEELRKALLELKNKQNE